MSTGFDRQAAKAAIKETQGADPEFDAVQSSAHDFQLKLTQENNRHSEHMRKQEIGFFGRAFGGEKSAPTYVAFIVTVFGLVAVGFCWGMAAYNASMTEFWSTQAERAMAFAASALAYIFGRGTR
ncbi:hypothetical protein [Rhizobium sp. OAE497]|uniref:hypothetical protein n=1 Tax=Rhizobium sp. OAE497 TaxID=2663796 RepID=UPI0018F4EEC2